MVVARGIDSVYSESTQVPLQIKRYHLSTLEHTMTVVQDILSCRALAGLITDHGIGSHLDTCAWNTSAGCVGVYSIDRLHGKLISESNPRIYIRITERLYFLRVS